MKISQLFFLIILFISSQAQRSNTYQSDLSELQNILQKTPSYQTQIKGQKLIDYSRLVEKLRKDTVTNISGYKYFYNLAQLFFPINDNHLSFYQTANFPNDSDFPTFTGNVDSLKSVLKIKYVSLPNLIAGYEVVKEFLQYQFTPEIVGNHLEVLLHDSKARNLQFEGYKNIKNILGDAGTANKTAKLMYKYLIT